MTDRDDALQSLADAYQKETGVKVRLELYAPSDIYAAKVRAAAQTGTLPDIFGVLGESHDLASFIKSGHVADLTAVMEADGGAWKKQLFPKAVASNTFLLGNQYQVNPGIYGVPIDVTNIEVLYNKDLFQRVGLDPAKPPQTWKEWIEDWHALKAAGVPGLVSGWGETWLIDCFANNYAFNIMGEQKVLDTHRGKVPYTDPDWMTVLGLFDTIRQEGLLVPGAVTMVNKIAEQTFANGKAAFALNGSWCVNSYRAMNPDLSYGVMLPPRYSQAHPRSIWGGAGSSFMVNAVSPNREAAIKFLRWLTQRSQQIFLAKETLNLPANPAALGNLPRILAAFASRMDLATHPSQWPIQEDPRVIEVFDRGIQSILIGEKTPAEVASQVQKLKEQLRASS
jgi:ABC-type glycerol-3-phosphate transport system substrate-binding protein